MPTLVPTVKCPTAKNARAGLSIFNEKVHVNMSNLLISETEFACNSEYLNEVEFDRIGNQWPLMDERLRYLGRQMLSFVRLSTTDKCWVICLVLHFCRELSNRNATQICPMRVLNFDRVIHITCSLFSF